VRSVLFAKGYSYFGPLLGLITFVLVAILPWMRSEDGAITLIEHYVEIGKTGRVLELMWIYGHPDAAAAFLTVLIMIPLAFCWAFWSRPVISGLLFILSGLLLIYTFIVIEHGGISSILSPLQQLGRHFEISIGTYAIILIGILFLLLHFHYSKIT
jgi:hypothetical protein